MYPDSSGHFSFQRPTSQFSITVQISSLPEGVGIDRHTAFYTSEKTTDTFVLSTVENASLIVSSPNGMPEVILENANGDKIFADFTFSPNENLFSTNTSVLNDLDNFGNTFSIAGNVDCGDIYEVSAIIDTDNMTSKETVDFLFNTGYISEAQKIEAYCDMVLNFDFPGGSCIEGVVADIDEYRQTPGVSPELSNKIEQIFTVPYSEETTTTTTLRTIPSIAEPLTVSNAYFVVTYDSAAIETSDALTLLEYITDVRSSTAAAGFRSPLFEEGTNRYNIYLIPDIKEGNSGTYASTFYQSGSGNTSSSYIVFYRFGDYDDDLSGIIAHEYFHMIQNAYNYNSNTWFKEAAADWAEFAFGETAGTSIDHSASYLEYSHYSIDSATVNNNFKYGASVYPLSVDTAYGGKSAIKRIYENYSEYSKNATESQLRAAITEAIQVDTPGDAFEDALEKCAAYTTYPSHFFSQYATTNTWTNPKTSSAIEIESSYTANYLLLEPSAFRQIWFRANSTPRTLSVTVDYNNSTGNAGRMVRKNANGSITAMLGSSITDDRYTVTTSNFCTSGNIEVVICPINTGTATKHISITASAS